MSARFNNQGRNFRDQDRHLEAALRLGLLAILGSVMVLLTACGNVNFDDKGTQPSSAAAPEAIVGPPPVPGFCAGKKDDPSGCIQAVCIKNGNNYLVQIRWCDQYAPGVQNVIRRKATGSDWDMSGYLSLPPAQRIYTDTNVQLGQSWDYSQKFDPNITTTVITVPITEACCQEF